MRRSSARAAARSAARTPLQAIRNDRTAGVWLKRYGLPSETRTVGRVASVTLISSARESGRATVPRPESGPPLAADTGAGARAVTARAETYAPLPHIRPHPE